MDLCNNPIKCPKFTCHVMTHTHTYKNSTWHVACLTQLNVLCEHNLIHMTVIHNTYSKKSIHEEPLVPFNPDS